MAEVGVMGGGFSKLLKHLFPEKDLYLYDTFSGFDDRDTADEYKNGAINQTWANVFKSVTYENTKNISEMKKHVIIEWVTSLRQLRTKRGVLSFH